MLRTSTAAEKYFHFLRGLFTLFFENYVHIIKKHFTEKDSK